MPLQRLIVLNRRRSHRQPSLSSSLSSTSLSSGRAKSLAGRDHRRQSLRRLFVESLESRQLLAGDFLTTGIVELDAGDNEANQVGALIATDDVSGDLRIDSFSSDLVALNDPPTINAITDLLLGVNAGEQTIALSGLSGGFGEMQSIRITATSDNVDLVPDPVVSRIDGSDTGTLTFTPLSGQRGIATITVSIEDAGPDGDFDAATDNVHTTVTFDIRVSAFAENAIRADRSPVINELVLSPTFGDRDTQQLIELRGGPNARLEPNTFLVVVNEENFGRGQVREIFDLSGQSFGANGYLTIVQAGSPHVIDPQSAVLRGTGNGFVGIAGGVFSDADNTPGLIGGATTLSNGFFLIQSATPPRLGDDIDVDNDGLADFDVGSIRAGWSVLDSVSVHPFVGSGDQAYGQILLAEQEGREDPTTRTVEPGVPILVGRGSGYAARFGESLGSGLDDWILGTAVDNDPSGDLLELLGFSTELPTSNLLLERELNHFGRANFFGGVRGTLAVLPAFGDIDSMLPVPPATPAVGVQVLADTNDNGIRDTFLFSLDPDTIARPLINPFAGPFDPIPTIPLTHAYPGVTISTADNENVPFNFEVRAIRETNIFVPTTNFIFSHAGVNFFNDNRRLRFDFSRPVSQVSIVAVGPVSGSMPTRQRIEAYNANDELIGTSTSGRLFPSGRQTIGINAIDNDIAYAVAYTDEDTFPGTSPFGRFDTFAYRQSEAVVSTDTNGQYEIRGLVPGTYNISFLSDDPVLGLANQSVVIDEFENFVISPTLRRNTLPEIAPEPDINIDENTPVGTSLGLIDAVDADGQELSFAIVEPNVGGLTVDPVTGEIFVGDPAALPSEAPSLLDFESNPSFDVTVAVSDSVGTVFTTVRLTLNDVNEAPVVNATPFIVSEGTPSGSVIGQVVAVDPDTAKSQTLFYEIIGPPDSSAFQINPGTGLVTLVDGAAIDFETAAEVTFIVRVSDNGEVPQSTEFTQVIRVIDQNDPPGIATTLLTVPENPTNAIVGRVTASDPDVGQTHAFELIGGTGADTFAVRFDGTVVVRPGAVVDFESIDEYSLIVRAIDSGAPPLARSGQILVRVTDVNEPPVLSLSTVDLVENAPSGTPVTTLTARDPDAGGITPTISLLPIGNGNNFRFDPSTGELFVADGAVLDFETTPVQTVVMRLQTPATLATPDTPAIPATVTDVTLAVRLIDANDTPIVVTERVVLSELATPGSIVGRVEIRALDPDTNDQTTLMIIGGNAADRFTLDAVTGVLRVAEGATFDADGSPEPLNLEVRVTDAAGLTSSRLIDIVLNNVNEPPVFNLPAPPAAVIESGEFFELVIPVSAITDPEGQRFTVTVFDQTGRLPAFLSFDPATRTLSGIARPDSVGTFEMTIRAFEAGPLPLGSGQTFTLTVAAGEAPLTNKRDRFDVDASNRVSAIDALRVINFLSSFGSGEAVSMERPFSGFLDVSGDGRVTALDAVQIVNELAIRGLSSPPESEQILVNDDDDNVQDAAIEQYLQETMLF